MLLSSTYQCGRCNHAAGLHTLGIFYYGHEETTIEKIREHTLSIGCAHGVILGTKRCGCKEFELQNLDLVEKLAKERNLI